MASIPSKRKVERTLKEAERAARATVKEANRAAGKQVSKGDYAGSEKLIALAKMAGSFAEEIRGVRHRWRDGVSSSSGSAGKPAAKTPLWQYYQPILKALVDLNGRATRTQIESHLENSLPATLSAADTATNARGVPWWRIMIRRARKPMMRESFIERGNGTEWIVTSGGRKALEAQSTGKLQSIES